MYWSLWEMLQLIVSYIAIGLYVYRSFETSKIMEQFERTYGNGYIRLQRVGLVDSFLGYAIGILVFMASITYIKLLR
jgi:hypothetical protein